MPACKPPAPCAADVPASLLQTRQNSYPGGPDSFADEPAPNGASGGMHVPLCRAAANGCERFPELHMRRRAAGSLATSSSPSSPSFSVSSARGEFADEPAPNRASGGMNIPFCRAPANGCEKFPESRMRRRGGKPDASVEKRGRGMKNRTILRSGVKPSCGIVRRPG